MSDDDIDWSALARWFEGGGSAEERDRFRRWLAADAARAGEIEALREAWERARRAPAARDPDLAWERLTESMARTGAPRYPTTRRAPLVRARRGASRPTRILLRAAAVLAVTAALGAIVGRTAGTPRVGDARPSAPREYATAVGQRAMVTLIDGSVVVLGARSTLRVAADFGRRRRSAGAPAGISAARDVYLQGEAYFTVAHDAAAPFTVHAGGAATRALGTAFNVRAQPGTGAVEVAVTTGRVSLRDDGSADAPGVLLDSGRVGRLVHGGEPQLLRGVDARQYVAWTDGRLVFRDTPLPEVLDELARWYDVRFRLADRSLAARPLTGTFQRAALDDVLRAITLPLDLRYEMRHGPAGREVTLLARQDAPGPGAGAAGRQVPPDE